MKNKLLIAFLALCLVGCNDGRDAPRPTTVKAALFGDSLTNQSNTTIAQFLPIGSDLMVFGVDGHTAYDALIGYGGNNTFENKIASVPNDYCVVISYGTNEAIQSFSSYQYINNIRLMIDIAKRNHTCIILEAPVAIRDVSQEYISALFSLGFPVSSKPYVSLRDGVHPDSLGYIQRAAELANVLSKNQL